MLIQPVSCCASWWLSPFANMGGDCLGVSVRILTWTRVLITGPRGLSSVDPYQTTNKGVAQVNSHNRRTKNIYVCIGALFTWTPRGDWGEKTQRHSEEDTCALLFTLHSSRHQVMALEVCVYRGKSINYWLTVWRSRFSLLRWRPKTWPQRRQTWENEEQIQNPPPYDNTLSFPFFCFYISH